MKIIDILRKHFIEEHPEVLDDEFTDKFHLWIESMEIEDILEYE